MAAKRSTLPRNFPELLSCAPLETLKAVFDTCDVNARFGRSKEPALSLHHCPDDLARWLVEQGADMEATNVLGATPLLARSGSRRGRVGILLELGADMTAGAGGDGTPLHQAASAGNIEAVKALLQHGTDVHAVDRKGKTPLARSLFACANATITSTAIVAELLLAAMSRQEDDSRGLFSRIFRSAGTARSGVIPETRALVQRIGERFEFARPTYNPAFLEETGAALDRLYALFDMTPVPPRILHDGRSPILVTGDTDKERFRALWSLLVPGLGAAATVQGEVIRIVGRIDDELQRNGGINWSRTYRLVANALVRHLASGTPLPPGDLDLARRNVANVKTLERGGAELLRLAVLWVSLNPAPIPLAEPTYTNGRSTSAS